MIEIIISDLTKKYKRNMLLEDLITEINKPFTFQIYKDSTLYTDKRRLKQIKKLKIKKMKKLNEKRYFLILELDFNLEIIFE